MMKYENERLVIEIPAHTEEFDTIGLSAMLTYIARRNPEIIRQMEVQDLSMETVLQEYYQVISREGMALLEQKYLKESSNGKRAVADTAEARMAYTQLEDVLEAELGASFQKDGYCGADPGSGDGIGSVGEARKARRSMEADGASACGDQRRER